jgi:hypothetical protein
MKCCTGSWWMVLWGVGCSLAMGLAVPALGQTEAEQSPGFNPPAGLTQLAPDSKIWLDLKRKLVVVDGYVAVREGALEMFACPRGTKEHESVVAVQSPARYVHAALLATGARSGTPVRFEPEYAAATGTVIDVFVLYRDQQGDKQQVRAQEWVKNSKTGATLEHSWVFAGSGFWTDPSDGQRYYYADGGDFICVSNFPTATLDLPIPSSQANDSLLYVANTEKIPPRGTPVRLVLIPRLTDATAAAPAETAREAAQETPSPADDLNDQQRDPKAER